MGKIRNSEKHKLEIKEKLSLYTDIYSILSGTIQQAAQNVLDLEKRLREENAVVKNDPDRFVRFEIDIYIDRDDGAEISFKGIRIESDQEFSARQARIKNAAKAGKISAANRKKSKEEKEFELFKQLSKKYKGKVL